MSCAQTPYAMARFFCESMSPTPAVLGLPPTRAEDFIKKAERWDRGLYAAPVGVINGSGCELIVALRAAPGASRDLRWAQEP